MHSFVNLLFGFRVFKNWPWKFNFWPCDPNFREHAPILKYGVCNVSKNIWIEKKVKKIVQDSRFLTWWKLGLKMHKIDPLRFNELTLMTRKVMKTYFGVSTKNVQEKICLTLKLWIFSNLGKNGLISIPKILKCPFLVE